MAATRHAFFISSAVVIIAAAAGLIACSDTLSDIMGADGGVGGGSHDAGEKDGSATTGACKNKLDCAADEECQGGKCIPAGGEDAGADAGDLPDAGCTDDAFCKGEGQYCNKSTGACMEKGGVIAVTCEQPPAACGELNFGAVQYGQTIEKEVTVKNVGAEVLKVTDVYLESGTSATFTLDPVLVKQHELAPNDGFTIKITYQQDDNLPDDGSLIISSMDLAHPTVRVLLKSEPKGGVQVSIVDASKTPPEILWPEAGVANWVVDFGAPTVGQKATKAFTLANTGDPGSVLAVSKVEPIQLGGDWTVTTKVLGQDKTLPAYLNQGDMLDVEIVYDVKNNNPVEGGVQVTCSDPDADDDPATTDSGVFTVKVAAGMIPPQLAVAPLTVDFGQVQINPAQPAQKTFRISNTAPAGVNLSIPSIGLNAGNPDFDFSPKVISGIAPGSFVDVTVLYKPTATGDDFDKIAITSSDPLNPKVDVQIAGKGIDPILDIAPKGDIDFGDVMVGNAAAPKTVTLTKSGDGEIQIDSIALTAGTNASFTLSGLPAFPVKLVNNNDATTFKVNFLPNGLGAINGAIEIKTTSAKYATVGINLAGKGIDCCLAQANASGVCNQQTGQCAYACGSGYADLNGDLSQGGGNGCECQLSPNPPASDCASALDIGSVVDSNMETISVMANITEKGKSAWFVFKAIDSSDIPCDKFHLDVTLTVPGNFDYDLQVCKGAVDQKTCPPTADCKTSTNQGGASENVNGWDDTKNCVLGCCGGTEDGAYFFVKVSPKNVNAAPVCDKFTVTVKNGKNTPI